MRAMVGSATRVGSARVCDNDVPKQDHKVKGAHASKYNAGPTDYLPSGGTQT